MKKSIYLLPALALAMASCSSDDPISGDDIYNGPVETSYLTVNISAAGALTRGSDGTANNDYEDGVGNENTVNSVRFYFFDAFGNSVKVKNLNGTLQNYLDWTGETEDGQDDPVIDDGNFNPDEDDSNNIEKQLMTTLVINSVEGDKKPASIVAVINPTQSIKDASITSIETLNHVNANYSVTADGPFVMSNSVYANGTNKIEAVEIPADRICTTKEAAMLKPVDIYVERVNAKVRVRIDEKLASNESNITLNPTTTLYSTQVKNTSDNTTDPQNDPEIYVKLLGWNVTTTAQRSNLMKEINPNWTNEELFNDDIWNWTSSSRHRSFWGVNPTYPTALQYIAENGDYNFGTYSDAAALNFTTGFTYVQENAAKAFDDAETDHPTQVIIAAELVDATGKTLELAEWGTILYTQADLLKNLANMANIYSYTYEEETTSGADGSETTKKNETWTKLDPSFFKFVSAEDVNKADFNKNGRYLSFIQLVPEKITNLNLVRGDKSTEIINADVLNGEFLNWDGVKVWESGKTYYYFPIQHLGSIDEETGEASKAAYGVVRNHVYECNIESIKGLGTPIFEPGGSSSSSSKTIYPEKPDDNITMIAAKINVLTWRLVKSGVQISWP